MKIKLKYSITLFTILSFLLFAGEVFARGGGGGSGGGGGGGGGSGGSGKGSPIALAIWAVVFLVIYSGYWYIRRKKIKKAKEIITKAEASDSVWQEITLNARVADVFIRFQKDWTFVRMPMATIGYWNSTPFLHRGCMSATSNGLCKKYLQQPNRNGRNGTKTCLSDGVRGSYLYYDP